MSETTTTYTPEQMIEPVRPDVDEERLGDIARDLVQAIDQANGSRFNKDATLDYWNDLYEMNVEPRDNPWPNAASICVPIVARNVEQLHSRIASACYVPRFYVVNGNTKEAQESQHDVERFYISKFYNEGWLFPHTESLHSSIIDGTAWIEVLWKKKVTTRNVVMWEPEFQDTEQGPQPVIDPQTQKPKKRKSLAKMEVTEHNGPELNMIRYRDLTVCPASAADVHSATTVARKLFLSESDLWELVDSGLFSESAVRMVIEAGGQNQQTQDPQGTAIREQGGTIIVSDEPGADDESFTGLYLVYRCHTRMFDLDGDERPEENVVWVAYNKRVVLGWGPYEYWHGKRPFVRRAIMPRPGMIEGFSAPERLRSFQEEATARRNQRADYMDMLLSPPMWYTSGVQDTGEGGPAWGPGLKIPVTTPNDIGLLTLNSVDMSSFQDEATLWQYAGQLLGVDSPVPPASGNQKMSQRQAQAWQTASNLRLDLMCMYERYSCKEIIEQIHQLYLQYGDDVLQAREPDASGNPGERFSIPAEILARDYTIDVAGSQGSLDKESRRQDTMTLYAMLLQNPLVQGNLERIWVVTRKVLDEFNIPDATAYIGTMEDAKAQAQAAAQAAEKKHQEEMQLQALSHTKVNSGPAPKPKPVGGPAGQPPPPQEQVPLGSQVA